MLYIELMKDYIPKIGERVPRAAEFVGRCDKLLDVGCGDGVIQHFISDRAKYIYGVDGSKEALKKASKRGIFVKLVNLNIHNIPYKTTYFDTVTCLDVIEHVLDPQDLLTKINKVLKKNGTLILSTPNIRFTNHIYDLVVKGKFPKTSHDPGVYDGGHIHFLTYGDMIDLIQKTGFKLVKKEGIINKARRGWKGRVLEFIFGKDLMLEFRSPGILLVCEKK